MRFQRASKLSAVASFVLGALVILWISSYIVAFDWGLDVGHHRIYVCSKMGVMGAGHEWSRLDDTSIRMRLDHSIASRREPESEPDFGHYRWREVLDDDGSVRGTVKDTWYAPYWMSVILCTLSLLIAFAARRRSASDCCRTCGYNLTANTSGVCPECGSAVAKQSEAAT